MRVALLTLIEPPGIEPAGVEAARAEAPARAHLRVGAVTLARHQLAVVLALGCERVICVAPAFDGEMMNLQHVAEDARANFHVISGTGRLAGLVSATDELVVLSEGLLVWPDMAKALFDHGPVVLIQPIERGLAAGFERVDINHAAAGAIVVPGYLVERLNELPGDVDPCSALQRIALQSGVPQRLLPPEAGESGRWTLVRSEAEAHAAEATWIRLHTGEGTLTPALALARHAVRLLGPALLHAGSNGTVVGVAASVLALLGLVTGWFGFAITGFVFCAVSWVVFLASALLGRVERESLGMAKAALDRVVVFGWIMDVALVLLMTWASAPLAVASWAQRGFAPIVLLGLVRLVPPLLAGRWARWLEDRSLLAVLLGLAAGFGLTDMAVRGMAVVLLALGITGFRAKVQPPATPGK